jgi:hypothetical protein
VRTRNAVVNRGGSVYRDKQECLDHVDLMRRMKMPLHGVEIVMLTEDSAETNHYKTVWFKTQTKVYDKAATFIKEQMVGVWNYAEIKI